MILQNDFLNSRLFRIWAVKQFSQEMFRLNGIGLEHFNSLSVAEVYLDMGNYSSKNIK